MSKRTKILFRLLFVIYVVVLIYFLFFSEHYGRKHTSEEFGYNIVPFEEILRYIKHADKFSFELIFMNLYGNIIAFIPLGFGLPCIFKSLRSFIFTGLSVACFSLFVEVTQYVFSLGTLDVDDFILNTLGGVIGYIVFYLVIGLRKKHNCSQDN